jgi:hypothetical protein
MGGYGKGEKGYSAKTGAEMTMLRLGADLFAPRRIVTMLRKPVTARQKASKYRPNVP